MPESSGTIWVCVDCAVMHANGETGELDPTQPEPWALYGANSESYDITYGITLDEHECTLEEAPECDECGHLTFSKSQCEGCGSTLAGAREAFTVWEQTS